MIGGALEYEIEGVTFFVTFCAWNCPWTPNENANMTRASKARKILDIFDSLLNRWFEYIDYWA
jgi:hypothetical protein